MPLVKSSAQAISRLAAQAFIDGKSDSIFGGIAEWSGNCTAPIHMHMKGLGIIDHRDASKRHNRYLDAKVRCRACAACLRSRGRQWAHRAMHELAIAQRSWFVTLTLNPHAHYVMLARARKGGHTGNEFLGRHHEISKEITLWVKRVRKNSKADLRLFVVCEAHKSGLPHYHVLLHEKQGSPPCVKRAVQSAWKLGFSTCELADENIAKAAWYLSKYLCKSVLARPRASTAYGRPIEVGATFAEGPARVKPDVQNKGEECVRRNTPTTPEPQNKGTM